MKAMEKEVGVGGVGGPLTWEAHGEAYITTSGRRTGMGVRGCSRRHKRQYPAASGSGGGRDVVIEEWKGGR